MDQNVNYEGELGIIKISDEVVGIIAGLAASEVKGITSLSLGIVEEWTQKLGGKKNILKGVKVNVNGENAVIDLFVIVEFGVKITEVAEKVQINVKNTVETLTGLLVDKVNVYIQNIQIVKSEGNN